MTTMELAKSFGEEYSGTGPYFRMMSKDFLSVELAEIAIDMAVIILAEYFLTLPKVVDSLQVNNQKLMSLKADFRKLVRACGRIISTLAH